MKLMQARLKFDPREYETKYGLKCQSKVEIEGEEVALWDKPDGFLSTKKKGDFITVGVDSQGRYKLLEIKPDDDETETPQNKELTPETKRQMMAYSQSKIKQFLWTMQQIKAESEACGMQLSEESIRSIASGILISCEKKFGS